MGDLGELESWPFLGNYSNVAESKAGELNGASKQMWIPTRRERESTAEVT